MKQILQVMAYNYGHGRGSKLDYKFSGHVDEVHGFWMKHSDLEVYVNIPIC